MQGEKMGGKKKNIDLTGWWVLREIVIPKKTKENLIAIYLVVFLLALIIIPILLHFNNHSDDDLTLFIYIGCAGGLGGTIFCMRSYSKHKVVGKFDLKWTSWYIFRPFISVIMGVFVYFFIAAGLMGAGSDIGNDISKGMRLYLAAAFLSGFFINELVEKLRELANVLFKKTSKWEEETK